MQTHGPFHRRSTNPALLRTYKEQFSWNSVSHFPLPSPIYNRFWMLRWWVTFPDRIMLSQSSRHSVIKPENKTPQSELRQQKSFILENIGRHKMGKQSQTPQYYYYYCCIIVIILFCLQTLTPYLERLSFNLFYQCSQHGTAGGGKKDGAWFICTQYFF